MIERPYCLFPLLFALLIPFAVVVLGEIQDTCLSQSHRPPYKYPEQSTMKVEGPYWNDRRRQAAAQRIAASLSLPSTSAMRGDESTTASVTLTAAWLRQHCSCPSPSPLASTAEATTVEDGNPKNSDDIVALAYVTHLSLTKIKDASAIVDLDLLGDLLPSLGQSAV